MGQTFKEKYNEAGLSWQSKAVVISLYHSAMCIKFPTWTMDDTALHFNISKGLVSENIRLAKAIDSKELGNRMIKCKTRESALKMIERRHYVRNK